MEKHDEINRQISDLTIGCDFSGIRKNKRLLDMVIFILHKGIQGAVHGVVLTGFHLDGNGGETIVIINQKEIIF